MTKIKLPEHPFVEAYHKGGKQRPTAIVIRSSLTTSDSGSALAIANMQHMSYSPNMAHHYIVDQTNVYHCVPDKIVSGRGECVKQGTLNILVCSEPLTVLGFWDDLERAQTLGRTAELVANLLVFYKIPMVYLDSPAQKRWNKLKLKSRGGIIVKIEGVWPWKEFEKDVRARITALKAIK